jgi:tricorn protease
VVAGQQNLALVRAASTEQRDQIGLYNIDSKQLAFVTSDRYTSRAPVFSPDGKWLYFLSARNFQLANGSPWGDRNMGPCSTSAPASTRWRCSRTTASRSSRTMS